MREQNKHMYLVAEVFEAMASWGTMDRFRVRYGVFSDDGFIVFRSMSATVMHAFSEAT